MRNVHMMTTSSFTDQILLPVQKSQQRKSSDYWHHYFHRFWNFWKEDRKNALLKGDKDPFAYMICNRSHDIQRVYISAY